MSCFLDISDEDWQPFRPQCLEDFPRAIRTLMVGNDEQIRKTERMAHEALDDVHLVLDHRDGNNLSFRPFCRQCI